MGYPLQYSCLENSMDRGAWRATVHGGHKESDVTEWLTLQFLIFVIAFTSYNFFLVQFRLSGEAVFFSELFRAVFVCPGQTLSVTPGDRGGVGILLHWKLLKWWEGFSWLGINICFSLMPTAVSLSVDFPNPFWPLHISLVLLSQLYPDLYLIILELTVYKMYLFSVLH